MDNREFDRKPDHIIIAVQNSTSDWWFHKDLMRDILTPTDTVPDDLHHGPGTTAFLLKPI